MTTDGILFDDLMIPRFHFSQLGQFGRVNFSSGLSAVVHQMKRETTGRLTSLIFFAACFRD